VTKQAYDYLTWRGEKYQVIRENFLEPYLLENYPIRPNKTGGTTDLYRGYIAELEVKDAQLYLTNLDVYFMDKPYPDLGNNAPEGIGEIARYEGMTERIYGTGLIVIAQDFIGHWDGFGNLHRFRKLIRFDFENGQPKQIRDFSSEAEKLRKPYIKYLHPTRKEVEETSGFSQKILRSDDLSS